MSFDHSAPEDEYFHREDKERLRKLREQMESQQAEASAAALKELHFMRCGKCGNGLKTQVFKGVEIDVCTACSSVLLDPGELEQLVGKDKGGVTDMLAEMFSFTRTRG